MTNEDKIGFADMVIALFSEFMKKNDETLPQPVMIGLLKMPIGINGFKPTNTNSPVFEHGDRYFIYMETIDGKSVHKVKYYKNTLKEYIDFIDTQVNQSSNPPTSL